VLRELSLFLKTGFGWVLFVLLSLIWGILVVPLTRLLSRVWPSTLDRFSDLTRAGLRFYIASLPFFRVEVSGPTHRDRIRVLVVNHQSWLDPIVMLSLEPRLSGPARGYMFRVPIVRSVMQLAGFYPAEAGDPAPLARMREGASGARRRGGGLLFFPEGTRSPDGEIAPFQRGAFRVAYDHALPIQPVVIEGLDRVLPPGRLLARMPGRYPVRIRYLPLVEPPFALEPLAPTALEPTRPTGSERRPTVRALAARVHASMAKELARMRAERAVEADRRTSPR